jgi:hypothetical protein
VQGKVICELGLFSVALFFLRKHISPILTYQDIVIYL